MFTMCVINFGVTNGYTAGAVTRVTRYMVYYIDTYI